MKPHRVVLPLGSTVHPSSGATRLRIDVQLQGLLPFSLACKHDLGTVRSRRLDLWIRHGVAVKQQQAVIDAISLQPTVKWTAHFLGNDTLRITAAIHPLEAYRLQVGASSTVLDALGQPLAASDCAFRTGHVKQFWTEPDEEHMLYLLTPQELQAPSIPLPDWYVMARGSRVGGAKGSLAEVSLMNIPLRSIEMGLELVRYSSDGQSSSAARLLTANETVVIPDEPYVVSSFLGAVSRHHRWLSRGLGVGAAELESECRDAAGWWRGA